MSKSLIVPLGVIREASQSPALCALILSVAAQVQHVTTGVFSPVLWREKETTRRR
jgi:hypothetical protein